jgi:hypothetical protein
MAAPAGLIEVSPNGKTGPAVLANTSPLVGTNGRHRPAELAAADIDHRQQFRQYVLSEAEPWHREHLGRLYGLWDAWNAEVFGGRLQPPYLLLAEPTNPRRLGDCSSISGFGGKSQIRIRASLLVGTHPIVRGDPEYAEGRFLFVAECLLHEMIHQWHQEVTGRNDEHYHGHGPAFRDECNRIGKMLGLPAVRCSKARGKDNSLPSCSYWPHCVRPADYYGGAYIARPPRPPPPKSAELRDLIAIALADLEKGNVEEAREALEEILSCLPVPTREDEE